MPPNPNSKIQMLVRSSGLVVFPFRPAASTSGRPFLLLAVAGKRANSSQPPHQGESKSQGMCARTACPMAAYPGLDQVRENCLDLGMVLRSFEMCVGIWGNASCFCCC